MTLERAPQLQSLRQLVRKIDNLVIGELRKRDPYLKFVEERSDPMLAIYPADGAGFKRHVDNSAGDGRVLTVVSSDALLAIALATSVLPHPGGSHQLAGPEDPETPGSPALRRSGGVPLPHVPAAALPGVATGSTAHLGRAAVPRRARCCTHALHARGTNAKQTQKPQK